MNKKSIPNIINRLKTSELLANDNSLSLVRYGDGELGQILNKTDIGFQKYNTDLSDRLYEIIKSEYDSNILICIPDVFGFSINRLKPEPKKYWYNWVAQNRKKMNSLFTKRVYGDSLVSRLYLPWKDTSNEKEIVLNLKKTWSDKKVIIVEGEKTRWGVGNDLLVEAQEVKRILCPAENAFDKYREILSSCMDYLEETEIFILALGPTATVLAYDLAKAGTRALDLGHFDLQYEYMINESDYRVKIKGKFNNEIDDNEVENCVDEKYLKSIVKIIK